MELGWWLSLRKRTGRALDRERVAGQPTTRDRVRTKLPDAAITASCTRLPAMLTSTCVSQHLPPYHVLNE